MAKNFDEEEYIEANPLWVMLENKPCVIDLNSKGT